MKCFVIVSILLNLIFSVKASNPVKMAVKKTFNYFKKGPARFYSKKDTISVPKAKINFDHPPVVNKIKAPIDFDALEGSKIIRGDDFGKDVLPKKAS